MSEKAYIIVESKIPDEAPMDIIRAYTSIHSAIDCFKSMLGVDDATALRTIEGEWIMNRRLLDDDSFYRIIETDLGC